jgi:hypothetical protein
MSFRTTLMLGLLFAAVPTAMTLADEARMTDPEIAAALSGNSVHGMWGETEYYSYFDANGETIYTTKDGSDVGTWQVKGDQYCSVWAGSGEDCYTLLRDGDKIIWVVPASGQRYDSTLIEGKPATTFK